MSKTGPGRRKKTSDPPVEDIDAKKLEALSRQKDGAKELAKLLVKIYSTSTKLTSVEETKFKLTRKQLSILKLNPKYYALIEAALEMILEKHADIGATTADQIEAAKSLHSVIINTGDALRRNISLNARINDLLTMQSTDVLNNLNKHLQEKGIITGINKVRKESLNYLRQEYKTTQGLANTLAATEQSTDIALDNVRDRLKSLESLQSLVEVGRKAESDEKGLDLGTPIVNEVKDLAITLGINLDPENMKKWDQISEQINLENEKQLLYYKEVERALKHHQFMYDKINATVQSTSSKFNTWKNTLMLIPGFGQAGARALDVYRDATEDLIVEFGTAIRTGKGIGTALTKGISKFVQSTKGATSGISKLTLTFVGLAAIIVGSVVAGLKEAYEVFKRLSTVTKDVSQSTGLSARQSYMLAKNSLNASLSSSNFLSTIEDITQVQTALVNEFGRIIPISGEAAARISNIGKLFGVSQDEAGKLDASLRQLGADEELSTKLQFATAELAEAYGIAPGVISKDLIQNANLLAKSFSGYPKKAALAAIEVRKLGFSLSDASKTMEHLFNVEESLTAQMEASVGLNRMIDMSKARQYALVGDIGNMMKEVASQAGSYESFTRLSVPQKILLARAAGMEVETLERSLYIQKFAGKLTDEQMKAVLEKKEAFHDLEKLDDAAIQARLEDIQATEVLNAQWEKLKNQLGKSFLPLMESLADLLIDVIIPAANVFVKALRGFLAPVELFGATLKGGMEGFKTTWNEIFSGSAIGIIGKISLAITGLAVGVSALSGALSLVGAGFGKLRKMVGAIGQLKGSLPTVAETATGGGGLVDQAVESVKEKAKEKAGGLVDQAMESVKEKAQEKIGGLADKAVESAKGSISGEDKGSDKQPKGFLTSLADGLAAFGKKWKNILKGAVVLGAASVILAGSFRIGYEIIKNVQPGIMLAFAASMGILGGALALLGQARSSILKGSGALFIASLAAIPFAVAMRIVEDVEPSVMLTFGTAVGILGGALALAGQMKSSIMKGSIALVAMSVGAGIMAYGMQYLKGIEPATILAFSTSVAALGLAFALAGKLKTSVIQGSLAIAAMGVGAGIMAYGMQYLKDIKPESILAFSLSVAALGVGFALAGKFKSSITQGALAMGGVAVALAGFTYAFSQIGNVDFATQVVPILGLIGGLGLIAFGLGKIDKVSLLAGVLALTGIAAGFTIFAYAFSMLKGLDMKSVLAAVAGIGLVALEVAAMGVAITASLGIGGVAAAAGILALTGMGIALLPFAKAMSMVKGLDLNSVQTFSFALGIISGAVALMSTLGPAIAIGVLALGAIGLILPIVISSFKQLSGLDISSIYAFSIGIALISAAVAGMAFMGPVIAIGVAALAGIGLALLPMAKSVKIASEGIEKFIKNIKSVKKSTFTLIADGVREIADAVNLLDLVKLSELGMLAGLSFVDPNTGKKSSTPVENRVKKVTSENVRVVPPSPNAVKNETPLNSTTSSPGMDSTGSSGVRPNGLQSTSKSEILLNRIAIALEQSLKSPKPIYIQFDDGTIRQLNSSIRRTVQ
jgi:hypothetical protein